MILQKLGSQVKTVLGDNRGLVLEAFWKHHGLLSSENLSQIQVPRSGSWMLDGSEMRVFEPGCCLVNSRLRGDVKRSVREQIFVFHQLSQARCDGPVMQFKLPSDHSWLGF